MRNENQQRVCPIEIAGWLDNSIRRLVQNPNKILKPFINNGMVVLDLGCGPGFFTVEIADMVGETGKVIAADLQEGMLTLVNMKIKGTRLEQIVELHKCEEDRLGLSDKVDFVFAFYMVHEVPDQHRLFKELKNILNPGGKLFIIEPRFHVSEESFNEMINQLISNSFETISRPKVFFSRSVVVKLNSLHHSSS